MRAADLLIQTLEQLGTKYLFSLSGNQIMSVYDACIDSGIKIIHVRHESAAVHMADAWGRLTGQPGVVLIAGGPGFANSLSATYVAEIAESPIVVLSGHAALGTLGRRAFQEIDQVNMAKPVSKASWMVTNPNEIGADVAKAFEIARSGRPGPVHLALPHDLLKEPVNPDDILIFSAKGCESKIEDDFVQRLNHAVQSAERPLLLAGPAVLRKQGFQGFAERLATAGVPVVGMESPRGVDDPSRVAFGKKIAEADLLVLMGKKIDYTLKFGDAPHIANQTKIIHVDHDEGVLELTRFNGENLELVELVLGDPLEAIGCLADELQDGAPKPKEWLMSVQEAIEFTPAEWQSAAGTLGKMHPAQVGRIINDYLAGEEAVFVSDGGDFCQWMQALIKPKHRVINGKSGSIGTSISLALGARLAYPNAKIVACCGDGAFGFLPFEMNTALRYDLPITLVVGNDSKWGAEYQIQLENYGPDRLYEVDLNETRYDEVVKAIGGWGCHVESAEQLPGALAAAEQSGLPACLNVPIISVKAPKLD